MIKKKKEDDTGMIFVGFLMIGMGLGFYYNNFIVGLFLGLGFGFLASFIAKILLKKRI